ncbi:MAG: biotin transporter BioY [Clostridia bacterium]|nr:biotin transporter BioY [Clostridia bacterium]
MKKSAFSIAVIALMTCIVIICSQIAIPFGGILMTLQTFAIALCGYILGIKGLTVIFVYLTLGAVGIPVFAGFGSSFAFLFGQTGGFLFGFLPLVFFCGLTAHIKSHIKTFLISLIGLFLCHAMGIFWFSIVSGNAIFPSFLLTSFPYLLKDLISLIFARILTDKLRQRYPQLLFFRHLT